MTLGEFASRPLRGSASELLPGARLAALRPKFPAASNNRVHHLIWGKARRTNPHDSLAGTIGVVCGGEGHEIRHRHGRGGRVAARCCDLRGVLHLQLCGEDTQKGGRGRIARGCDEHLELLSEDVDVSNDLSQGPPSLSADVVLRPERAYSWVYPSTGAKHIQIGTRFSVSTYRQVGSAGRWLAYAGHFAHPGYFEQRLLVADPWTWMEPADLVMVSRDQLPDGPAWHLHGPQLHCCYSIDLWVGLDGLPRRAVEVFPGGNADGIECPPYPMRFTCDAVLCNAWTSGHEPGSALCRATC